MTKHNVLTLNFLRLLQESYGNLKIIFIFIAE